MKPKDLKFISDRMRYDYLTHPAKRISTDSLNPAPSRLLTEDNDFVYVKETPNYLVLTEEWTEGSRIGLYRKYGDDSDDTIMIKLTPRFKTIGKIAGLKMIYHGIVGDNSVVVYKKPRK